MGASGTVEVLTVSSSMSEADSQAPVECGVHFSQIQSGEELRTANHLEDFSWSWHVEACRDDVQGAAELCA